MATLNILCSICMDYYKNDSVVCSTIDCGHLFHRFCILKWLENSKTCPRCTRHCIRQRIHRVYLDFTERSQIDYELDEQFSNYPNWLPLEELNFPRDQEETLKRAIKSGKDEDGHDTYVARVYFENDLLPANYVPEKNGVYAPWGCHSHFLTSRIELMLDCKCEWVEDQFGHVPDKAIITGYSEMGDNLYTGRGLIENTVVLGKVHPSHRVLYMPYQTKELNTNVYEVLVPIQPTPEASSSHKIQSQDEAAAGEPSPSNSNPPPAAPLYPELID